MSYPQQPNTPGQQPQGPPQQYPPQQYPGQPYPGQPYPAPAKKKSNTGLILGLLGGALVLILGCVIGGIALLGAGAQSVSNGIKNDQNAANKDVTITACTTDSGIDGPVGKVTAQITNSSDSAKTYSITVAFESKDGSQQYDTAILAVDSLAAGQSTTQSTEGFTSIPGNSFRCRITDVTRF